MGLPVPTKLVSPRGGPILIGSFAYDPKFNFYNGTVKDFNGNTLTYSRFSEDKDIREVRYSGIDLPHSCFFNPWGQQITFRHAGRIDLEADTLSFTAAPTYQWPWKTLVPPAVG